MMPVPPRPPLKTDMTLRDWFAGQALTGVMSMEGEFHTANGNVCTLEKEGIERAADYAYKFADAMLKRRAK
jgi:hypothetical protein